MNCDKKDLLLYAITDRSWLKGDTLYEQVEKVLYSQRVPKRMQRTLVTILYKQSVRLLPYRSLRSEESIGQM